MLNKKLYVTSVRSDACRRTLNITLCLLAAAAAGLAPLAAANAADTTTIAVLPVRAASEFGAKDPSVSDLDPLISAALAKNFQVIGSDKVMALFKEAGMTTGHIPSFSLGQIAKEKLSAALREFKFVLAPAVYKSPNGRFWLTARLCDVESGTVTAFARVYGNRWSLLIEQLPQLASQLTEKHEPNKAPAMESKEAEPAEAIRMQMEQTETIGEELAEARLALPEDHPWVVSLRDTFDASAKKLGEIVDARVTELGAVGTLLQEDDMPAEQLGDEMSREVESLEKQLRTGYLGNVYLDKELEIELVHGVTIKFVLVPCGKFLMGAPEGEKRRCDNEGPQHPVTIRKAFYMGAYEVTQKQFEVIVRYAPGTKMKGDRLVPPLFDGCSPLPSRFRGENLPVESVRWDDANKFCSEVTRRTRYNVHLPTEAQWEYACRAGSKTPFSTGESLDTDHANYDGNYVYGGGSPGRYAMQTMPVGSLKPNAWGLYDMHGNVWEMCSDIYAPYTSDRAVDPTGYHSSDTMRVCRGGSWVNFPWHCRSSCRFRIQTEEPKLPTAKSLLVGFRVVCDIPEDPSKLKIAPPKMK